MASAGQDASYRYTPGVNEKTSSTSGVLTRQQRDFYEKNGFLVIPRLVEDELLDACRDRFLDIINGKIPKGRITIMKDIALKGRTDMSNERIVNKVQDLCWDDVFSQYLGHPGMLDYVENFTGPNIKAVHTMLINKPPDLGKLTSRHPLHQDLHYFPFRPADRIVASWTAMEHIDGNNGCLIVIPGSHRDGILYQHEYPEWENGVNKMFHGIRGLEDKKWIELHMEKGDTVFFHPLLVHGSGSNTTTNFRKAISGHYASCADCYYIDVVGTTQESIAKEIDEVAKKRGLGNFSFQDFFRFRSRTMRGMEGKL